MGSVIGTGVQCVWSALPVSMSYTTHYRQAHTVGPFCTKSLHSSGYMMALSVCAVQVSCVTHGLFDVAGEDVNLEVLWAAVALSEGKTVTFHRVFPASSAEQHFVDGEGGDLCPRGLVHDPGDNVIMFYTQFQTGGEYTLLVTRDDDSLPEEMLTKGCNAQSGIGMPLQVAFKLYV